MSEQDTTGYWADGYSEGVKSGYRAGLAEGFARGTRAAADACDKYQLTPLLPRLAQCGAMDCANAIRALRPEEGK